MLIINSYKFISGTVQMQKLCFLHHNNELGKIALHRMLSYSIMANYTSSDEHARFRFNSLKIDEVAIVIVGDLKSTHTVLHQNKEVFKMVKITLDPMSSDSHNIVTMAN